MALAGLAGFLLLAGLVDVAPQVRVHAFADAQTRIVEDPALFEGNVRARHLDWREDGGFAYVMRFTGGCGEMGADEAAARVREYGGSCWGLDEAVECERALNERFPLSDGKLV